MEALGRRRGKGHCVSMNLFLDASAEQRQAEIADLKKEVGECSAAHPGVAGKLAARAIQHEVRKGHGGRVLYVGADSATNVAAPRVSEACLGT